MHLVKDIKKSLPNVVLGASVLRVTGSRSVVGIGQKQYNTQWRFKKYRKRGKYLENESSLPCNVSKAFLNAVKIVFGCTLVFI